MTYSELFQGLVKSHVVSPRYVDPLEPSFPKWYNENETCEYHANTQGHTIEKCIAFKRLVKDLIKRKIVSFHDSEAPCIAANPLTNNQNQGVNAINEGRRVKENIEEVKTPLKWVYEQMIMRGLLSPKKGSVGQKSKIHCEYHCDDGHQIQDCHEFKNIIQKLMDGKEMQFFEEELTKNEGDVHASEDNSEKIDTKMKKQIFVISKPSYEVNKGKSVSKVVIKTPVPFAYKDNRSVPWSYTCQITTPKHKEYEVDEVGGFTKSGRCYARRTEKARAVVINENEEKMNEPVKIDEAQEFLKFLKHSEYNIVEQLHKTPARILILSLLLHSEVHRNTLLKVLNETFVAKDIPVECLDRLVGNINTDNFIYFNDDEIPEDGKGRCKTLHIIVHCKWVIISGVLIDNGSALNVMPWATLNRLPVDTSRMKVCGNIVRAFDGTERSIMGKITIPLRVGPATFEVEFVVMDIHPNYNCLLGRPWIHMVGAVPSSLHQKLRFIMERTLITIKAEEEIIASITTDMPYVEVNENALESSFQSLEFVNATFVPEGKKFPSPQLSKNAKMQLKETLARGAIVGKGLGKELQGITKGLSPIPKRNYFGIGYKPTYQDRVKDAQKLRDRKKARAYGQDAFGEPIIIPLITQTFTSGGFVIKALEVPWMEEGVTEVETLIEDLSINAITNDASGECSLALIHPCPPGYVLNNYTVEEIPVFFKQISESQDINCTNNDVSETIVDFENDMCLEESKGYKDDEECELNPELVRLIEQESKQILPHQEKTETVNLGIEDYKKEVKIGTSFSAETRSDLIHLLHEFKDVFA
ncbi:uncharacterized protein LOC120125518 [Hibiscus syriacus]|uniref:uncharacterized protein LOC120125518 n=1 Tax=Hibiscus syriacus TaxID=106335 RepID=UPI001921AD36|nr:uncharacterized protein LOC120125518 [Hibiscus syriacus]